MEYRLFVAGRNVFRYVGFYFVLMLTAVLLLQKFILNDQQNAFVSSILPFLFLVFIIGYILYYFIAPLSTIRLEQSSMDVRSPIPFIHWKIDYSIIRDVRFTENSSQYGAIASWFLRSVTGIPAVFPTSVVFRDKYAKGNRIRTRNLYSFASKDNELLGAFFNELQNRVR